MMIKTFIALAVLSSIFAGGLVLSQPATAAPAALTEQYYLMPKQGVGSVDDVVRAKYQEEVEEIAEKTEGGFARFTRRFDDPDTPSSPFGFLVVAVRTNVQTVLDTLAAKPDVMDLGAGPVEAAASIRSWATIHPKLSILAITHMGDSLKDTLALRTEPLIKEIGTDVEDWTDTNGNGWTDAAQDLTKVHVSGTDGRVTFTVQSNQGDAAADAGGLYFTAADLHYLDLDSAEDQTVQLKVVTDEPGEWGAGQPAARVVTTDTDTFFTFENYNQLGDDTRLNEVVNGTFSELDTGATSTVTRPIQMKMYISTYDATQVDIDCAIWADSGSEGSPAITGRYTVNAALQGQSGYGAVLTLADRGAPLTTVDDLQFTNDDAAPAERRIIIISKLLSDP